MDDIIISVENVGKRYRISHQSQRQAYASLREVVSQKLRLPFEWFKNYSVKTSRHTDRGKAREADLVLNNEQCAANTGVSMCEDFWALQNISFQIRKGDVVGIIGRNGAGKSTLLKILSRITEPTEGQVRIRGRIASLLEVGTGFHPELTGRENIYLNGAILGMSKAEIRDKFDEIVAFSEVEKFLDTPVKRYSSGMYVRLAFGVAAHLEPEILIVDEVLAVGDAEFQAKCLGKMKDVSTGGRTVLFVSHNLSAIVNLCSKGLLLDHGRVVMTGDSQAACAAYAGIWQAKEADRRMSSALERITLVDSTGAECSALVEGAGLRFQCDIRVPEERCLVSLIVRDARTGPIFELFDNAFSPPARSGQPASVEISASPVPLLPGRYIVDFWLADRMSHRLEKSDNVLEFDIVPSTKSESSVPLSGAIKCNSTWRCK